MRERTHFLNPLSIAFSGRRRASSLPSSSEERSTLVLLMELDASCSEYARSAMPIKFNKASHLPFAASSLVLLRLSSSACLPPRFYPAEKYASTSFVLSDHVIYRFAVKLHAVIFSLPKPTVNSENLRLSYACNWH